MLRKAIQENTTIPQEVADIYREISKNLYRSPKKQKECFNAFCQAYAENESTIKHLAENPDKIATVLDSLTELLKNVLAQMPALPKKPASILTLLSLVGPAQSQNLSVVTGEVNGNNLCSGFYNCVQGAIVNSNNSAVVASFNAFLNLGGKVNGAVMWAFNDCMNPSNLGKALKDILLQNASSAIGTITSACASNYNSGNIGGYVGGQVDNLNVEQCMAYQNSFNAEAQRCLTDARITGLGWAIAGIVIGAIVFCVGAVLCCYACCSSKSCKN